MVGRKFKAVTAVVLIQKSCQDQGQCVSDYEFVPKGQAQGAKMQSTVLEVQRIISQSEVDLYISITLTIFPRR